MLKTLTTVLMLGYCCMCMAQTPAIKPDTLTIEQIKDTAMTAEKLFKLPAGYSVVSFDIVIVSNGEIFKSSCQLEEATSDLATRKDYFQRLLLRWTDSGFHATKITFAEIRARKGDRIVKLMPQTFVLP